MCMGCKLAIIPMFLGESLGSKIGLNVTLYPVGVVCIVGLQENYH